MQPMLDFAVTLSLKPLPPSEAPQVDNVAARHNAALAALTAAISRARLMVIVATPKVSPGRVLVRCTAQTAEQLRNLGYKVTTP